MTVTRDQFIAEARLWLGTPWQHQARLRGVGVDCVGLVLETARALGLTDAQFSDYSRRPDATLQMRCDDEMEHIPVAQARAADVLLFAWNNSPVHLAIMTGPDTIIHAYAINRKVVEHRIDERWRAAIHAAYAVPGVN